MKAHLYMSLLAVFFLAACQKDISVAVESCSLPLLIDHELPEVDSIQIILEEYVDKGLPGAVVALKTKDSFWTGAAGFARLENNTAMKPCHVFHSASVAKTYHAVAALILVSEGVLSLDDPMSMYLPDWVCKDMANYQSATIKQLMDHTSGIPDFIEDTDHITDYFHDLMRDFSTEQYLDYVCGDEPSFSPGNGIEYSNTNTVLLALIMDELAGDHASYISEKVLKKGGLDQTYYKREEGYPAPSGAVNTYVDTKGNGNIMNSTSIERNFANMNIGHDAMMATATDFALFMEGVFTGVFFDQAMIDTMSDTVSITNNYGYGLGLEVAKFRTIEGGRLGHTGGSLGAANWVFHYPDHGFTLAICSNFGDFLNGPMGELFYEMIYQIEKLLLL